LLIQPEDDKTARAERFPKQFGEFVLENAIWRGAHSTVYRARDIRDSALVALKVFYAGPDSPLYAQCSAAEFEARRLRELSHPNIVGLREHGAVDEVPFLSFTFIHGCSVEVALKPGEVETRVVLEVVSAIARALHYAHSIGIIHRDLKPRNILVDDTRTPHVLDWGLSWKQEEKTESPIQSIVGTPAYMSPEQARGEEAKLTPATDVYSLGAILYHLLTGRPPFEAGTSWKTLQMAMSMPPEAPSRIVPSIDAGIDRLILTCLEKDPNGRYASAQALDEDLQRVLNNQPPRGRPSFLGRLFG